MPDQPTTRRSRQPRPALEPPPPASEPESETLTGPLARFRAFIDQRAASAEAVDGPRPRAAAARPDFAPDFRQRLLDEYRQRLADATGAPAAAPATRQPPLPAPANNWTPIGPAVVRRGQASDSGAVSGRIVDLAVANGGRLLYVATANGGVWRSTNGGQSWTALMDAFDLDPAAHRADTLACGAIALSPTDANRLYVGTGEPYGNLDAYFGVGPLRNDTGGTSWTTETVATGSPTLAGEGFFRLAVDPGNGERVVAATTAGLYRREPSATGTWVWVRKQVGVFSSVVVARAGATTRFYAAQPGGSVLTSTDGDSWSRLTAGFPTASVGRVGLAVQPTDPTIVYALAAHATTGLLLGVWRLDGAQWRPVAGAPADLFGPVTGPNPRGQGWYDLAIAVDPNNVNRLYLGGSYRLGTSAGRYDGNIYRCLVQGSGSGASLSFSMTPTFIGRNTHPDVHALVFTPGSSDQLWVGCDGGLYVTNNATAAQPRFEPRNTGLATLTMNHLAMHPREDAVLFAGSQDNGTLRYTGEEVWLHAAPGDGGYAVINWSSPAQVLRTYVGAVIDRATDGGQGYASWSGVNVPLAAGEAVRFYAPLVGTPPSATPADANLVAFGSIRPWLSTTFGGGWRSIPRNTLTDDRLNGLIACLVFASATTLYAGTEAGGVYRFTRPNRTSATWTRTALHTGSGATAQPPALPVTSIAVDPGDASGTTIYVTLGGRGDYRRVWRCVGTAWQARSGPAAGAPLSLLNVQHNAIVVDPANPTHLYAGADIGVWRSTDAGLSWAPFSFGLPDAAVLDLDLHAGRRLLWANTHGRGVYEYRLDTATALPIELYVRDTTLDRGRRPTEEGLPNPTQPGSTVTHPTGPDIKVDVPTTSGYQTPTPAIDFLQFVDTIADGSAKVAAGAPTQGVIHNRVYVQVHNRGLRPAASVRVMLLLANVSTSTPNLPANFDAALRSGTAISTTTWRTVGFQTVTDVQPGAPKIAAFDLPSSILPPSNTLSAADRTHCLVALLHATDDPFTATQTALSTLCLTERKAARKIIQLTRFVGTPPPPLPPAPPPRRRGRQSPEVPADG